MSVIKCANCHKDITAEMEAEYSGWLTEYYCSTECAKDRYFNQMESVPVDFENLPADLLIEHGKLQKAEEE